MKIIGITGMPACGKGLVTDKLIKRKFERVTMSAAARAEMKKKGILVNTTTLRSFPTKLRREKGPGIIAELCKPLINKEGASGKVVIDGIRSLAEIRVFRKKYGDDFILIAVESSKKIRMQRILGRGRDDDAGSVEEFERRDRIELSWGLGEAISNADYSITNNGTQRDFEKKIDKLLNKILP